MRECAICHRVLPSDAVCEDGHFVLRTTATPAAGRPSSPTWSRARSATR